MYLSSIQIKSDRYPSRRFYPFNIPALQHPSKLDLRAKVAFLVGENGCGKSTLLEAVAIKCGIHLWDKPKRHLAHHNPFETRFKDYIEVNWKAHPVPGSLFRASTFREFADFIDDVALCDPGRLAYHGGQLLNTLSHGQGILSYLRTRYQVRGLYLLDEPEAALSPASQIQFLQLLQQFAERGSAQFIIATHSPILMACPGAQIFDLDSCPIREIGYQDTTHYRLWKQFLNHPDQFIEESPGGKEEHRPTKDLESSLIDVPSLC